jgi:FMN phosphatase YigB (HAD superfamily)
MLFRLLGPFEAVSAGEPVALGRRRERCLLALLLLDPGRPVLSGQTGERGARYLDAVTTDRRVRGIMFDAGGVLIRPVGGRWNPRYDFEGTVLQHHPEITPDLFPGAFAAGQRVLDAGTTTVNRTDYHRAILRVLGIDQPSETLLRRLEEPAAGPVIETYPEVRPVLDQLQALGLGMSVVSDTWVGLEALFRELDIERYFAGFVISEVLGCNKPDPRMYAAGSDLLNLDPADCLFVDDDPALVSAAVDLGYQGVTVTREGLPTPTSIMSLDELLPIVAGTAGGR